MAISLLREKIREKQARLHTIEAEKALLLRELQGLQREEENYAQSTIISIYLFTRRAEKFV